MDRRWARSWHAATALAVIAGLAIQIPVAVHNPGHFRLPWERGLNTLAFFTIQSNLLVGVAALLLAVGVGVRSHWFPAFRLTGLVAITITGVVYHVALDGLLDLDTWGVAANQLLHTVVPVMTVVGWLAFGPRGRTAASVARRALLFPIAWLAFTLVRGAAVHWYPYPFVDVDQLGYLRALVNCVWVALLFFATSAGAVVVDRVLARSGTSRVEPGVAPPP